MTFSNSLQVHVYPFPLIEIDDQIKDLQNLAKEFSDDIINKAGKQDTCEKETITVAKPLAAILDEFVANLTQDAAIFSIGIATPTKGLETRTRRTSNAIEESWHYEPSYMFEENVKVYAPVKSDEISKLSRKFIDFNDIVQTLYDTGDIEIQEPLISEDVTTSCEINQSKTCCNLANSKAPDSAIDSSLNWWHFE